MAVRPAVVEELEERGPLESVIHFIEAQRWPMRRTKNRVQIEIEGSWIDYTVAYVWDQSNTLMHFALGFELSVPKRRHDQCQRLLVRINECLELGHFEYRPEVGLVVYRSALPLLELTISDSDANFLLQRGLRAAESYRYFFQCVVAGMSADEAFDNGQMLFIEKDTHPC